MSFISIRKMQLSDYDALYTVWLSCKGMGLNNVDDTREGIERFLARNPETCLVAELDGAVVGGILIGTDGRRGYIYHTAVHPDHQRQGIGSALVEAALKALHNINIHKVALVVFERNQAGNLFWEQQGFTTRTDIIYRNRALTEIIRFDT